jgi:hypothetical protein
MALDGTYAGLKASIANWLHRSDTDDYVEDLVQIGERRIWRELRPGAWETTISGAMTAGVFTVGSTAVGIKEVLLQDGNDLVPLMNAGAALFDMYPNRGSTDTPEKYQVRGAENVLYFGPSPDAAYTVEVRYFKTPPTVATTVTCPFYVDNPGLYLFAALAESAPVVGQDDRLRVWEAKYEAEKNRISEADNSMEFGGPLQVSW